MKTLDYYEVNPIKVNQDRNWALTDVVEKEGEGERRERHHVFEKAKEIWSSKEVFSS